MRQLKPQLTSQSGAGQKRKASATGSTSRKRQETEPLMSGGLPDGEDMLPH